VASINGRGVKDARLNGLASETLWSEWLGKTAMECGNTVPEPGQSMVYGKVRKPFGNHIGRSFLSKLITGMLIRAVNLSTKYFSFLNLTS